jgi:acyl dehydratase
MNLPATINPATLSVGDALPDWVIDINATRIVAGAIATRDFMPVHHDKSYANAQGAPDVFMNILSDTAYTSRYLTDWAGPNAMVRKVAIRLGVPVFPGHTLTYTGEITALHASPTETTVEIALRAVNELGEHVGGTATISLPNGSPS